MTNSTQKRMIINLSSSLVPTILVCLTTQLIELQLILIVSLIIITYNLLSQCNTLFPTDNEFWFWVAIDGALFVLYGSDSIKIITIIIIAIILFNPPTPIKIENITSLLITTIILMSSTGALTYFIINTIPMFLIELISYLLITIQYAIISYGSIYNLTLPRMNHLSVANGLLISIISLNHHTHIKASLAIVTTTIIIYPTVILINHIIYTIQSLTQRFTTQIKSYSSPTTFTHPTTTNPHSSPNLSIHPITNTTPPSILIPLSFSSHIKIKTTFWDKIRRKKIQQKIEFITPTLSPLPHTHHTSTPHYLSPITSLPSHTHHIPSPPNYNQKI